MMLQIAMLMAVVSICLALITHINSPFHKYRHNKGLSALCGGFGFAATIFFGLLAVQEINYVLYALNAVCFFIASSAKLAYALVPHKIVSEVFCK